MIKSYTVFVVYVFIFFIDAYNSLPQQVNEEHNESVIENHLKVIKSYMNLSENPCTNFYGYACGNWSRCHYVRGYYETTGLVDLKVNQQIIDILENHSSATDLDDAYNKLYVYYKACTREKDIKIIRYLELIKPSSGIEWPVLHDMELDSQATGDWNSSKFDWILTIAKLRKYGLNNAFVEDIVMERFDVASEFIIDLDRCSYSRGCLLPHKFVVIMLLEQLGLERIESTNLYKKVHGFEKKLIELYDIDYNETTHMAYSIRELQNLVPEFPWRRYFSALLNRNIGKNYRAQIRNLGYFRELAKLIETSSPRTVCNFIMVKFLNHLIMDGTNKFNKIECVIDLRSKMELAVNALYKNYYFNPHLEADVARVLNMLRKEFASEFEKNILQLNKAQKNYLQKKLKNMRMNIGNLPKNTSTDYVNEYYKDVMLEGRNYYKNHLILLAFNFHKEHKQIDEPINDMDDFFFIALGNSAKSSTPYYLVRRNLIVLPLGFLQPPIFHSDFNDFLKISLLGFLLGHEIAHGFDNTGVIYNSKGNVVYVGNDISLNPLFVSGAECLGQTPTNNVDERIADNIGVRLAYDTLFSNVSNTNQYSIQPNFTDIPIKQLFFLNLAQFFCGSLAAKFEEHDADNVRLHLSFSNFEPFAEAFHCQTGTRMNPKKRCSLY